MSYRPQRIKARLLVRSRRPGPLTWMGERDVGRNKPRFVAEVLQVKRRLSQFAPRPYHIFATSPETFSGREVLLENLGEGDEKRRNGDC